MNSNFIGERVCPPGQCEPELGVSACCPRGWEPDPGQLGAGPSTLESGQSLASGQSLQSPGGRGALTMQPDGNLVLYDTKAQPHKSIWATNTAGHAGATATMQADGNLVVSDRSRKPIWSSGSSGHAGASARLQDDGNFVVYAGTAPAWSSGTANWAPSPVHHGFNVGRIIKSVLESPVTLPIEAIKDPKKLIHDIGKAGKEFVKIDKFVLEQAQGIVSLIPGVGTAISSAISAGLAVLEGGGALFIAVKTAYGAIPIPVGIRTFTDIVLNTALDLLKHGTDLKNDAVKAARDAVGSQLPAGIARDVGYRVYDTLAHLIMGKLRGKPTQAKVAAALPPAQLAVVQKAAASGQPLPAAVQPLPPTAATYKPLGQAEQAQSTQVTVTVPAGGAAYGPYPNASAAPTPAGTTAGVGNLGRGGGGGHGGGGHGGGGGGWHGGASWHGGGRPGFRGRGWRGGYGWGGWGWGGPWWPYVIATADEVACASWGSPIDFPAAVLPAVRTTLINSGGDPVVVRGADGGLYLLSLGGPRIVMVRPCVGVTGVGSVDDDVLKAMALDLLGSLRRTGAPQYATRSVMNFARAWNAASADTQIDTSGKYTQETAAALNAALSALAPGSGAVPAAVL